MQRDARGRKLQILRGSLAKFLQKMRTERLSGILVPLIQLLLWPVLP